MLVKPNLFGKFGQVASEQPESLDLPGQVEKARQQWLYAQQSFNQLVEPDLIDAAIHELCAAERQYSYLLKLIRENNQA